MREVKYGPRYDRSNFIFDMNDFLETRGFFMSPIHKTALDPYQYYIRYYEWAMNNEHHSHVTISRGPYEVHDPGEYIAKNMLPLEDSEDTVEIFEDSEKFLQIRKIDGNA